MGALLRHDVDPRHEAASASLHDLPALLDDPGWCPVSDQGDVAVYTLADAAGSGVNGFKTVTELVATVPELYAFLRDICGAMAQMNTHFARGEVLDPWPVPADPDGVLVRTAFDLPPPLAPRVFLHGLHGALDPAGERALLAYTPVDRPDVPPMEGYLRCPTALSGQRLTATRRGTTRVEHVMTYRLGGWIPGWVQDRLLVGSHVSAYVDEWRALRGATFPPALEALDGDRLIALARADLAASADWPADRHGVAQGRLPTSPRTVIRTTLDVAASLETVTEGLADRSIEVLPAWNDEFVEGQVLQTLQETDRDAVWKVRVRYGTPSPLADRAYVYRFSRHWCSDDEVLITYCSVRHEAPEPEGVQRALLHPSVHHLRRLPDGGTRITHLLATDLAGRLGPLQDRLLSGALRQAHHRDLAHQTALWGALTAS